jgi:hypothetical protein
MPMLRRLARLPGAAGETKDDIQLDRSRRRDDDDDDDRVVTRRVVTARGVLGDLLSILLTLLFAYLVAAKVVVRKVAESDAKVRTAVDTAERETVERQLVQARLQVLQAQVEPHFLFNTLAAVDYLIETDPPRASQMQKALITYLRGALPQMRQESSTLGRELGLVRSYLELIKMRIEDRLEVQIAGAGGAGGRGIPADDAAVGGGKRHQARDRAKPEGGRVKVTAWVQNEQLWVEVDDTGVGFVDDDLLDSPTRGTGLGLNNIRERLQMLYGARAGCSCAATTPGARACASACRIARPWHRPPPPTTPPRRPGTRHDAAGWGRQAAGAGGRRRAAAARAAQVAAGRGVARAGGGRRGARWRGSRGARRRLAPRRGVPGHPHAGPGRDRSRRRDPGAARLERRDRVRHGL